MDRYWVGGTGNWDASTTTNWSTSSGGAGGASVPTSADNVIFDSASNATAYTVTVTATANCADLTIGNPLAGAITFAGASALNIYGSLSLASGMTRTYTGAISFKSTSTGKIITMNGVSIAGSLDFNGVGGGWTLQDAFTNTGTFTTLTNGTLNTNGQTVSFVVFAFNTGTKTLTLGASAFNCSNSFRPGNASTNGTLNANTSTITLTTGGQDHNFGGFTYNVVSVTGIAGYCSIYGANTFATLTLIGTTSKIGTFDFNGNNTITGTLTITGNSAINRVLVKSDTLGTARTITAAAISVDKADFQDITGAGVASWDMSAAAGYTGDCGGNSMKALGSAAFTAAATCNWSAGTTWSTATWSNHSIPLPQDTATFTTAGTVTITQDMPRIGSVDFTGSANKTWTTSTTCSVFGSINLTDLATLTASTQTYTFEGRGSNTLDSAGKEWAKTIAFNCVNSVGTVTLSSDLISSSLSPITRTSGTFAMSTYTIKLTNSTNSALTFAGGSQTYNNLWFARGASTGNITISGNNTFNDLKDTGTAAHSLLFTTGTTQTVTTFTVNGTVGNLITINSTTTGTHALVKAGGGTITCDYLNIQHSVATPSLTWLATNSTNNQAVATAGSGWYFGAFPAGNSNFFMFF